MWLQYKPDFKEMFDKNNVYFKDTDQTSLALYAKNVGSDERLIQFWLFLYPMLLIPLTPFKQTYIHGFWRSVCKVIRVTNSIMLQCFMLKLAAYNLCDIIYNVRNPSQS